MFAENLVEGAASRSEVEIEDANVEILIFREKCERPNAPEEVVEEAAVKDLALELVVVTTDIFFFVVFVFFPLISVHEFGKVLPHVLLDHLFLFVFRHQILGVLFHAISCGVSVVNHCLVDINGEVHGHWVPASVFVIDDEQVTVVGETHEDVVLMNVVMAQHRWKWILSTRLRIVMQVQRAVS